MIPPAKSPDCGGDRSLVPRVFSEIDKFSDTVVNLIIK